MAASGFHISDKNIGGRKLIYDQLINHQKALQSIKPTMVEVAKPPKAHVNQGGEFFGDNPYYLSVYKRLGGPLGLRQHQQAELNFLNLIYGNARRPNLDQKYLTSPEYSEIRETYRRIKTLKAAAIDNKKPATYKLSKKINDNRRRNQHDLEEHIKNLASLQKRISAIGSQGDRKKNPYDPIAHPSLFFRKVGEFDESTSLGTFVQKVQENAEKQKLYAKKYEQIIKSVASGIQYGNSIHGSNKKGQLSMESTLEKPITLNHSPSIPLSVKVKSALQSPSKRARPYGGDSLLVEGLRKKRKVVSKKSKGRPTSAYTNIVQASHNMFLPDQLKSRAFTQNHQNYYSQPVSPPQEVALQHQNLRSRSIQELQARLIDVIVNQRLYKNTQLEELFTMAIVQNTGLGEDNVRELCDAILTDLDKSTVQ